MTVSLKKILEQDDANDITVVGDVAGGVAAKGERYGWAGTQEIRSTYSTPNPASLVIFVMALSMEEYFWNWGYATTTLTQFFDLYSRPKGQDTIKNLGLTMPS